MKYIISGTNRPNSRSLKVALIVQKFYQELGEPTELIDLTQVGFEELGATASYGENVPIKMKPIIAKLNSSDGIIMVIPEYNGSFPGALKYFIDHWSYPDTFEFRPFALIGVGTRFGGLRPVEHMQGVLGFRNSFIYPERVFITNIYKAFDEKGDLIDALIVDLLKAQARGFTSFVKALKSESLHANAKIAAKAAAKKV